MASGSKITETDIEIKNNEVADDIVDIEFKELRKKRFRLDRDNNRVIELDTSDMSTIRRLEEIYPKMLTMVDEAHTKIAEDGEDVSQTLDHIDKEMRDMIDYAFNSKVADKACPDGTLYDPFNGKFRFEYIFEKLIGLYDSNLKNEYNLMRQRVNKHTAKYTKKRK